jgi:hypothetical protein
VGSKIVVTVGGVTDWRLIKAQPVLSAIKPRFGGVFFRSSNWATNAHSLYPSALSRAV